MSIEKKLRDSFSEITPPTKNEAIIKNVIERADKMNKNNNNGKRKLNRVTVTIIAAATAIVAGTVTVGAATGWNFNLAFNQVSKTVAGNNGSYTISVYYPENKEQNPIKSTIDNNGNASSAETFDYLSGGKELDLRYSFDNFSLNIKGIWADNYAACVLYDIIMDKDFDYSPKAGWTEWEPVVNSQAVDLTLDEQPEFGMVRSSDGGVVMSQEDNILHCYTMPKLFSEFTWNGKTLILDFIDIHRSIQSFYLKEEPDYEELIFGENGLTVEIPIDFPIFQSTVWEINEPLNLAANERNRNLFGDKLEGTLKYFSASPISYRLYVETDLSNVKVEEGYSYMLETSISAGENTIPTVSGGGSRWFDDYGEGETGMFERPIEPSEITYITVCGQTFELN
ncbi:MAG: hypothetical protein ACI4J7_01710 [Ruminiclostridium sp.]